MQIKHMKAKKGQLRNETWFLYWLERQAKKIRLAKSESDRKDLREELLRSIATVELITGQKL